MPLWVVEFSSLGSGLHLYRVVDLISGLRRQNTLAAALRKFVLLPAGIGTIAVFRHGK